MKKSVCLASYNGSKFIYKQLLSILHQLSAFDELIIVDDASTDNTVDIVISLGDPRISLYVNSKNMGVALTFCRALNYASGDIIFLSDQDDIWHENKVAVISDLFAKSHLDLIVHDARILSNGKALDSTLFCSHRSSSGIIKNIFSNTYTGCCMAFRRGLLEKILPISPVIGIFHDAWIGVLAEFYGFNTYFLKIPLIDFNRHGENASSFTRRNLFLVFRDRIWFISGLLIHVTAKKFRFF